MTVNPELEQITQLVPPPADPQNLDRSWSAVEDQLKLALPTDYKAFIDRYGDGVIAGAGIDLGYIGIWNWRSHRAASDGLKGIMNVIANYESERKSGRGIPFDFYPAPGGLLPFGGTPNGDHFNWRTVGAPDTWEVVFYTFDSAKMILLEGNNFSKALNDILTHNSELVPSEFSPEILSPPYRFTEFNW